VRSTTFSARYLCEPERTNERTGRPVLPAGDPLSRGGGRRLCLDEACRAFGDGVDGGVGIRGGSGGHDGGVGHPESGDAAHAQIDVDDRLPIGADPARSPRVGVGREVASQVCAQAAVLVHVGARPHFFAAPLVQGGGAPDFAGGAQSGGQGFQVVRVGVVVRVDQGVACPARRWPAGPCRGCGGASRRWRGCSPRRWPGRAVSRRATGRPRT
jgi:hypothetical protein